MTNNNQHTAMSTQQIKKDIEEMISRIDEKYEAACFGNHFNYHYVDYGAELFFATCVRSVFYEIKNCNLYKFWEGISYESRVEFFVNIFKKDLFVLFECFDKDDANRFLRTIFSYHRFRKLLHYAFCRMENDVMGKEAGDEFTELYDAIRQELSNILE